MDFGKLLSDLCRRVDGRVSAAAPLFSCFKGRATGFLDQMTPLEDLPSACLPFLFDFAKSKHDDGAVAAVACTYDATMHNGLCRRMTVTYLELSNTGAA
jgi:hypothetical protein